MPIITFFCDTPSSDTTKMPEQGFQNLKANTVKGMLCIGRCYETGDGVDKDQAEAVKWYRMATEQGGRMQPLNLPSAIDLALG